MIDGIINNGAKEPTVAELKCNGVIVVDFGPGGGFLSGRNNG